MKKKNFKHLKEFNRWCNGKFAFVSYYDFNLRRYYVLNDMNNMPVYDITNNIRIRITKLSGETTERFLRGLYEKDLECNEKIHHFPSSFEELCIMNCLNGN